MLWSLFAMGAVNFLMRLFTTPLSFQFLLFLGGFTFGLSNVMFAVMYREVVPQEQQGRFFGMLGPINQALVPVGIGLGGLFGDLVSPFVMIGVAGVCVSLLAIWGLASPGLRDVK
jgi:DHA3 family macrolide efflux protein-like MFS transporter